MKKKTALILIICGIMLLQAACGGSKDAVSREEETAGGVVNPMEEVKDIVELQDKLSFMMLSLPRYYGEKESKYFIVGKNLAMQQCQVADHQVEIRQQEGSGDITGIYQMTYTDAVYEDVTYHYGEKDDYFAAWWENGKYAYSVMVTNITEDEFISEYAEVLVDMSIFNLEYETQTE